MRFLFVHQNYPGQFVHLAPALRERGHEVRATAMRQSPAQTINGVPVVSYYPRRGSTPGVHPWVVDVETKTIRAEAAFHTFRALRAEGFSPDAVIAHPGWGESLFVKEVWPHTRLGLYCEFFYQPEGGDVGFDPEFAPNDAEAARCRLRLKNIYNILHFEIGDKGISPTHWQASTFPEPFRSRITVVHDGIDTDRVAPNPAAALTLSAGDGRAITLSRRDEIVTFVNRNLEPYRGYHVFMRALPAILARRPAAHVLIVGGKDVSYGAPPDPQRYGGLTSWRDIFIAEVRPQIPDDHWARVHFLGNIPYEAFLNMLQISTVHVYLTYPFVLSWSLLEAMSAGCAIVASDTAPLHEAIRHGETGVLVPFRDSARLAETVVALLEDGALRAQLGQRARRFAQDTYDLRRICLPQHIAWAEALAASS